MNKEFNGFDEMVEALEENEDMVECKECFDLVPKVDCERAEVGYICPTCKGLRTAPAQARFVDPYDSYTQDFPEVTEYDPDSVVEYEKEPGLGDALADLIRDEYEAIEGYEVADETIQHAAIDEDEKDEILDTLDHIKEEEEEHIDELKELCPECDPEKPEESEEPEKLEEKLPREPQVYDDNGKLIKVKDPEILKIWGKVMDQAEADGITSWDDYATQKQIIDKALTPEEIEKLKKVEFEDGSIRAAYESLTEEAEEEVEEIPEEESPEEEAEDSEENENEEVSDLDSAYEAALEIANESGVGQVFGYARKETEEFVAIEPFEVDDPDAVEDDLMAVYDDVAYAYVAYPEKNLKEALFESIDNNSSDEELLEVLQSETEAVKSPEDTAGSLKNMTSAMKESLLNLSPADFAECTDSSRVELWGLEEAEDGVAEAVLIKSYDDVSDEDIQSCHDEMLELDGMFTFSFTASGKPSVYGWNAEQLRELIQAGIKGISFDNPAYEEAISLAWRIK